MFEGEKYGYTATLDISYKLISKAELVKVLVSIYLTRQNSYMLGIPVHKAPRLIEYCVP